MRLEALQLRAHHSIPELDVPHRVSTDNRPVLEDHDGPNDRLLALESINRHPVHRTPDTDGRARDGEVEPPERGVGAPCDEVAFCGGTEVRGEGGRVEGAFCRRGSVSGV